MLYALAHLGYTIPPQADAYRVGEAGPGVSYRSDDSAGPESDLTNRAVTTMTWNLIHIARQLCHSLEEDDSANHPSPQAIRQMKHGPSELGQ